MNNLLAIGQGTNTEIFSYFTNKYSYERIVSENKTYKLVTIRKYKQFHNIEVDHTNKTISINGKLFNTSYVNGYVYKKMKGNNIGCTNFNELIKHIKESSEKGSVFHLSTFEILKNLSKKANYIY